VAHALLRAASTLVSTRCRTWFFVPVRL